MADCDAVDFLKAWNLEQYIEVFRGKYFLIFNTCTVHSIAEDPKMFSHKSCDQIFQFS